MAQLLIQNLDDAVHVRLQRRAARNGRSMEEELQDILRLATASEAAVPAPLGTRIAQHFEGLGLDTDFMELRGEMPRPAVFEP